MEDDVSSSPSLSDDRKEISDFYGMDWNDIDQLMGFSVSFTNLSMSDFFSLNPREFREVVKISFIRQNRDYDFLSDRIRWLGWVLLQPNIKKGSLSRPDMLYKLKGEIEEGAQKGLSDEDIADYARDLFN